MLVVVGHLGVRAAGEAVGIVPREECILINQSGAGYSPRPSLPSDCP
jgi:hypothetical protein